MKNHNLKLNLCFALIFVCYIIICLALNILTINILNIKIVLIIDFISLSCLMLICAVFLQTKKLKSLNEKINRLEFDLKIKDDFLNYVENKMSDIKKYCHDARNILQILSDQEITIGQRQKAADEFVKDGEKLSLNKFCENNLVNSVIKQKSKEICENGIIFEYDLNIPQNLSIDAIDVCRCVFNILDNALYANLSDVSEIKMIVFKAKVVGRYLIISLDNTFFGESISNCKKNSGLGLQIIRDIAKKYNGYLETEQNNGRFSTKIYLKEPKMTIK